MEEPEQSQCKAEVSSEILYREEIPGIVDELVTICNRGQCFDHISPEPIPSREAIIQIIKRAMRILYPGYFMHSRVDDMNLRYYFGQEVTAFFEELSHQLTLSIRHEWVRMLYVRLKFFFAERFIVIHIEYASKLSKFVVVA